MVPIDPYPHEFLKVHRLASSQPVTSVPFSHIEGQDHAAWLSNVEIG